MKDKKRILDSVHGYIYIENTWVKKFIDTPYFQRLRRIEQTSGRSIYPSARHDRFIHSLGVFHIGSKIVDSIKTKGEDFQYDEHLHDKIFISYRIACLLHDCGHTPFSHTFEIYFKHNEDELPNILLEELNDKESFKKDVKDSKGRYRKVAPHEYLSAILSLKIFKQDIKDLGGIPDLVARMIIGIQYEKQNCFENCMISLIHGDVIDADRLDYVCRDRWASGYSTSTVDIERLVMSIHVKLIAKNEYKVCFDPSVMHDIEGVLKVKEFQQQYVINHHTVCYDQFILRKAMEHTAYMLLNDGKTADNDEDATKALKDLCKPSIMWEGLHNDVIDIDYLMDDDFICLMKRYLDNHYVYQWFSRTYEKHLLWKNKSEYFSIFPQYKNMAFDEFNPIYRNCDPLKLIQRFPDLSEEDFLLVKADEKKCIVSGDLNILVGDNVMSYKELYPDTEPEDNVNKDSRGETDTDEDTEEKTNGILFFYLYLTDNALNYKEDIINFLNGK